MMINMNIGESKLTCIIFPILTFTSNSIFVFCKSIIVQIENQIICKLFLFIFRHVVLPKELEKLVPKTHLMSEQEWRSIGVQQSKGWVHYMTHQPEPHILLFKRLITSPPPE